MSQPGPQVLPVQGLVLDWRRYSYRWSALVVTVRTDDQGRPVVVHEWVEAERLRLVKATPTGGSSGPTEVAAGRPFGRGHLTRLLPMACPTLTKKRL